MPTEFPRRRFATLCVAVAAICLATSAHAAPLTWGVNGAGGSGNWNTTTQNWFDG